MENNFIKPVKKWYKRKRWWLVAAAITSIAIWAIFFRGGQKTTYEIITTKRADLIQEVSVTGKIKPAQAVDLQFESAGRVAVINYKVGDKVNPGAIIASLENQEFQAAVTSARADLEKTTRNFNSLNDPSVSSLLRVELENAKTSLEQVKIKAKGDLATKYNNASSTLNEAMSQIKGYSNFLEYVRKTYFEGKYGDDEIKYQQVQISAKIQTVQTTFSAVNQPGTVVTENDYNQIDLALREMLSAFQSIRTTFTFVQSQMQSNPFVITSSTDRSSINSDADSIASELSAISTATQNIIDQRITNNKNISDAEAKLATAQAAFPTNEDILQKEAALLSAQSQLRKTLIVASFAGTIGKIDIERGQTVSSALVAVSLISVANYQIEADITEIDIGKVNVGNQVSLTLDAYGSQVILKAKVSAIDTSATIVEGVTTYKTIFDFDGPVDPGIRPNMTANIDIQTAKKENVISIPQRAVISKDGTKFVRIFRGDNVTPEERNVELGMSGQDGYVEIIGGLSIGEQVITFINN